MQIHELNTGTIANEDYTAVDNGTDTRKVPFISTVNALIQAVTGSISTALTSLSDYVGTGVTGTVSGAIATLQSQFSSLSGSLNGALADITSLKSRMTSAEGNIHDRLLVRNINATVSVECATEAITVVYDNADMSAYLPDGATLKGAVFGWTNGSILYSVNCQVSNGTLFLALYNPGATRTITTVAMQLFYTI